MSEKPKSTDELKIQQFVSLLTANQNRIYAFILSRVPRASDADDIMQETTSTMWKKFDNFEIGTDFAKWGLEFARYMIMSFRKKQNSLNKHLSNEVLQNIESDEDRQQGNYSDKTDALKKCMKKLNQNCQRLLFMRYDQEIPPKTIAHRIGKSVPYVYKTLARIHEVLLRCVRRTLATQELS